MPLNATTRSTNVRVCVVAEATRISSYLTCSRWNPATSGGRPGEVSHRLSHPLRPWSRRRLRPRAFSPRERSENVEKQRVMRTGRDGEVSEHSLGGANAQRVTALNSPRTLSPCLTFSITLTCTHACSLYLPRAHGNEIRGNGRAHVRIRKLKVDFVGLMVP